MQKHIITAIVISLGVFACTLNRVNSITTFAVEGCVYDMELKTPLEQVEVFFVDTGYDDQRAKNNHRIPIGISDENGEINARLNYFWGHDEGFLLSKPKKTFDIVLSKSYYKSVNYTFCEAQLSGEKYLYVVELKDVYLSPIFGDVD
jgi:hypothetical protein